MSFRGVILTLACLISILGFAGIAATIAGHWPLAVLLFLFSNSAFAVLIGVFTWQIRRDEL